MLAGVHVPLPAGADSADMAQLHVEWRRLGIADAVDQTCRAENTMLLRLAEQRAQEWMPGHDTLCLAEKLKLDVSREEDDLLREIWLTLLNTPVPLEFPSAEELLAAVRMRRNIVANASRTCLDFDLETVERPRDCWRYSEETGFVLIPGSALISSLKKACQPEKDGPRYSFSCYRASEYVVLLSIAEEAQASHPALLDVMQRQWERKALSADPFQDVFLHEQGTLDDPMPLHYYVPGDRVWFRNPDSHSSDVPGFEGSWVFYLGGGLFANFWKSDRPFSLLTKCLEIYHWRHGVFRNERGVLQMDEARVEHLVAQTMAEPETCARVFERMHRLRDARGVYAEGGCMDASREWPRFILPPHSAMLASLPAS